MLKAVSKIFGCFRRIDRRPGAGAAGKYRMMLWLLAASAFCLWAQDDRPSTNAGSSGLSAMEPVRLAPWQKRLTLGPGDVLDVSLYDEPESARTGLTVGPDGRLNFLEAREIMAAGLTVDELRLELQKSLAKYHQTPRVVINPIAYNSKKYYLLGRVVQQGAYRLDRPTTLIEALAKGGGFATTPEQREIDMVVDLDRCFLARKGAAGDIGKVPVNFSALFLHGDLSQNVELAPEDYLFFPAAEKKEVYVFGEVRRPGLVPYSRELTALRAVAAAGGFTDKAWKNKILLLRGNFNNPQKIVVSGGDILKAKAPDLGLENRDILFVHRRAWHKAEELVELAAVSFVRAAVIGWTGQNVGPLITEPLIK